MLRSALALAALCFALPLSAQPAREQLIEDVRVDDEDVRPSFSTLTAEQLRDKTYVSLLEIDDGMEKLIARGADVNAKGNSPVTPLALVKSMNCDGIVSALTNAGAR